MIVVAVDGGALEALGGGRDSGGAGFDCIARLGEAGNQATEALGTAVEKRSD